MKKLEDFKAGQYIKVDDYKSFIPSKINEDWIWNDSQLNKLLAEANLQLGALNGFAEQIPNIDIYIKMHVEKFINNDNINTPDLIKIAIIHYQFESIHPFLDGNGRTGRILIPIYLLNKGLLSKPCFYISDFIEKNKNAYYDFLSRVRSQNDILSWIKFFLEATIETAKTARTKFEKVVDFTSYMNDLVLNMSVRPENAKLVINCFYNEPTMNRKILMEKTGLKPTALKSVINNLLEKNLIVENTGYSRNQIFTFEKYINLFK